MVCSYTGTLMGLRFRAMRACAYNERRILGSLRLLTFDERSQRSKGSHGTEQLRAHTTQVERKIWAKKSFSKTNNMQGLESSFSSNGGDSTPEPGGWPAKCALSETFSHAHQWQFRTDPEYVWQQSM
jgi:hypothetical protein